MPIRCYKSLQLSSIYRAVPPAPSTISVVVVSSTPSHPHTHSSTHTVSYVAHCCCTSITTPTPLPRRVAGRNYGPSLCFHLQSRLCERPYRAHARRLHGRLSGCVLRPILSIYYIPHPCPVPLVGFIVLIVSFRCGSRCLRACNSKRTHPPSPSPSHTCPHAPATRGGVIYPVASAARSRCLLCVLEQRKRREAAERARADRDSLAFPPPPYPTSASPSPAWTGTAPSPEVPGRGTEEARGGVPPYTVAAPAAPPPAYVAGAA